MRSGDDDWRPSGWAFPARTTLYFLVLAAASLAALAWFGLAELRSLNSDSSEVRIDRAARAAVALLEDTGETTAVTRNTDGSPMQVMIASAGQLTPDADWDDLLDRIGDVNQGAANLFRFNPETQSFDRIATTFRTPEGQRVGGGQVEPGLISPGHPAFDSLLSGAPYVGEVPVAGRMRFAYLTPITETSGELVGLIAVDVGWTDDLNRINDEVTDRALLAVSLLLFVVAGLGVVIMFFAFRPLNRLIGLTNDVGSESRPASAALSDRKDEIGYLANGLARVVDLQRDLERRAYTDDLTSIPNRAAFVRELEHRFETIVIGDPEPTTPDAFALLIVDLDGFKDVNDGLGHQAGDDLLVSIAASLTADRREGEFLARLGGDEFALLTAPGAASDEMLDDAAERVIRAVTGVRQTSAGETNMTASIGIARIPDHGITPQLAMRHADLALYSAKREHRGRASIYRTSLSSPSERRIHVAAELRMALERDELSLAYQPLYSANDGRLVSVEGLARWTHEVEGVIPPLEFVPIAETAGLINELGAFVIDHACRQVGAWSAAGLPVPVVAVNVSTMQLWNPGFVDAVRDCLRAHAVPTGRLCLELTESVILQHEDGQHRDLLDELVDLGVLLSIDDFGTGYSSLSYLHNLPVHQVKMDRLFVAEATRDRKQAQLYAGVIALAQNLGLEVVTEGVETREELLLARQFGSDLVQGFHLGEPMGPSEIVDRFGTTAPNWQQAVSTRAG